MRRSSDFIPYSGRGDMMSGGSIFDNGQNNFHGIPGKRPTMREYSPWPGMLWHGYIDPSKSARLDNLALSTGDPTIGGTGDILTTSGNFTKDPAYRENVVTSPAPVTSVSRPDRNVVAGSVDSGRAVAESGKVTTGIAKSYIPETTPPGDKPLPGTPTLDPYKENSLQMMGFDLKSPVTIIVGLLLLGVVLNKAL